MVWRVQSFIDNVREARRAFKGASAIKTPFASVLLLFFMAAARSQSPPDLTKLASANNGSVIPLSLYKGANSTTITTDSAGKPHASFTYSGPDGTLTYDWALSPSPSSPLGAFKLVSKAAGHTAVTQPLMLQPAITWMGVDTFKSSSYGSTGDAVWLTIVSSVAGQTVKLVVTGHIQSKSLVLHFSSVKGLIAGANFDGWSSAPQKPLNLPYLEPQLGILAKGDLFVSSFLDWTYSQASSLDGGTGATYTPNTAGVVNPLLERLVCTAAWNPDEVLPNIPNSASPYRAKNSNGIVLDVWGGLFESIASSLHALAPDIEGRPDVIVHNWQRVGYDNGLPASYPANASLGGSPKMIDLVNAAKNDGFEIALHENYVDYYPNYPYFSNSDIALNPDGARQLSWLNPSTTIQSFAEKPTRMVALSQHWSSMIEGNYGTNACFLDVQSAVEPWFHTDYDAKAINASKFHEMWTVSPKVWHDERILHNGPVFGEGNAHWYWSGDLDGVEAQFGQGWPYNQGPTAPLLVDFDLLKIHPLQLNHGMGYYSRWWNNPPGLGEGFLNAFDLYRMQEVAFAHEGFLDDYDWNRPGVVWDESHMMVPLTQAIAESPAKFVEYENGGKWSALGETLQQGGRFVRPRIHYANDVTVVANSDSSTLDVGGYSLPTNGWLASGPDLRAGNVNVRGENGVLNPVNFAVTPTSTYVNIRGLRWKASASNVTLIEPSVGVQIVGPRTFEATYNWRVQQSLSSRYTAFVHFTDTTSAHNIVFQQDHQTTPPTQDWRVGDDIVDGAWKITVPASVPDGDYDWYIGLYNDSAGRLTLDGPQDDQNRVILGTIHVSGDSVTFTPSKLAPPLPLTTSPGTLTVGEVKTNGSVYVHVVHGRWVLQPFETGTSLVVWLDSRRFGSPKSVQAGNTTVTPVYDGVWWRLPIVGAGSYTWPK